MDRGRFKYIFLLIQYKELIEIDAKKCSTYNARPSMLMEIQLMKRKVI